MFQAVGRSDVEQGCTALAGRYDERHACLEVAAANRAATVIYEFDTSDSLLQPASAFDATHTYTYII